MLREFHAAEAEQLDEAAVETIGSLVECCVCDEGPENAPAKVASAPAASATAAPKVPVELPKGASSTPVEVKNVLHLPSSGPSVKSKTAHADSDDEEPQVEEIV